MIILRGWTAKIAEFSEAAFQNLVMSVSSSLRPIVRPAREEQARILGIGLEILVPKQEDAPDSAYDLGPRFRTVDGEIFTDGKILFVIDITLRGRSRVSSRLSVEEILRPSDQNTLRNEKIINVYYIGSELEHPHQRLFVSAAEAAFGAKLSLIVPKSERFKSLKQEGRASPHSTEVSDIEASRVLSEQHARNLAIAIKSSGGLLVRDLAKQLPSEAREQTQAIREKIASKQLVDTEIVVVCRKSQAQIARVPSQDVLRSMSEQGVKCACGRPIAEENVEEALSITELGRTLLDGNRWLTLLLVQELQHVGVPLSEILIEQQIGGDEIDCLAVISGNLVFFELKDKEFSLGNAYSFGAKIGIIRPNHAMIFSTHKLGGDAREHFERARIARSERADVYLPSEDAQIHCFEGLDNLKSGVESLSTMLYKADSIRILRKILALVALRAEPLILALEESS